MDKAAWVFVIIALLFGAIASGSFWFERVVVWALRTFHIFAFPNAIRVAVSLERDGAEWELGTSYLKHPKIGSIDVGSVHSVCVHLDDKQPRLIWEPNFIERRIIWDAVQGWLNRRIDTQLDKVLPT